MPQATGQSGERRPMSTRRGECPHPKISPAGHVCAGAGRTLAGYHPLPFPFHLFQKTALSNGNTACWAFTHANESLLFCAITKPTMTNPDGERRTKRALGPPSYVAVLGATSRSLTCCIPTCPSSGLSAKQARGNSKDSQLPYSPSCIRTCFLYIHVKTLQKTRRDKE